MSVSWKIHTELEAIVVPDKPPRALVLRELKEEVWSIIDLNGSSSSNT